MIWGNRLPDSGVRTLVVTVVITGFLLAIQPAIWSWVSSSAQALHDRRTISQQVIKLEEQVAKLQQEQAAQGTIDEQLALVLIEGTEVSQAVERIESIAVDTGVGLIVHDIAENTPANGNPISSVVITAAATGTSDRLLQYLDSIEHVTEITSVRDFVLAPAAQSGVAATNQFSLSFSIAFASQAAPQEAANNSSDDRFSSISRPTAPRQWLAEIGKWITIGSVAIVIALAAYRIIQMRRK